jgi:hypothetical protein
MTPAVLDLLTSALREQGPLPLDELHRLTRQAGSPWSGEQLSLLLRCASGFHVRNESDGASIFSVDAPSKTESLADTIVSVIRAAGPLGLTPGEIRRRLPPQFVTAEAQIQALARKSPLLERFGPAFRIK